MIQPPRFTGWSLLPIGLVAFAGAVLGLATAWAGPLPPAHSEGELTAEALAKPVLIYNRPYTGAIYADYVPGPAEVEAGFAPAMARNEYEPMQVGLYVPAGKEALKNVTLEVECAVPCSIGRIYYIPANELAWESDTSVDQIKTNFPGYEFPVDTKLLVNKRSSMPMFVPPDPRIAQIQPGRSAAFWVTFHTSTDHITAGTHKGRFSVSADGKALETVPFVVKVYPFALPRPKVHYGIYYLPYMTPAAFQGREFMKLYLADMTAHGRNLLNLEVPLDQLAKEGYNKDSSSPVDPPILGPSKTTLLFLDNYLSSTDYEADGGYNALKLVDNQIRMGKEAGLVQHDHPAVTYNSAFNVQNKVGVLESMRAYGATRDWPHFMLYMRDEPGPQAFEEVNKHVAEWKRLGATGIAAMSNIGAFGVGSVHGAWIVMAGQITPELMREAGRLGADVWTYDHTQRATNIELGRFYAGLYTWSLGLKGNVPYRYFSGGYRWDFENTMHFRANWTLHKPLALHGYVVASPSGPVPGVGWEGQREGIDDVRYLQLLEARVNAAGGNNPAALMAGRWLDDLRIRSYTTELRSYHYNVWGADFMRPNSRISPEDYHTIRATAAALIAGLPSARGELNPEPATWLRMKAKPLEEDAFAKASIDECLKALKSGTIKQKRQAAAALATRKAEDVLPARDLLVSLLETPEVRIVALRALTAIGPDGAPAIPALSKLLAHKDAFVRTAATYTLTLIGTAAADALAVAAKDSDVGVARIAQTALDKLKKQ